MQATAIAHPNIALSKYWGKLPGDGNRPAVPSLSLTLDGMSTRSQVRFDSSLAEDVLLLDGRRANAEQTVRVSELLDRLWRGQPRPRAAVSSHNDFPTASGLASSASAFAALAVAANAAAETNHPTEVLSDLARRSSASAARSLFGGFVELPAGGGDAAALLAARPLLAPEPWDVRLLVAMTSAGPKAVGSTEGMRRSAESSPLYRAWVEGAPAIHERVRAAVLARDLARLGQAAEHSALCMHAVAMASDPGLIYWNAATLEVLGAVRSMRQQGLEAYFTIDAGPHVKILTSAQQAPEIEQRVRTIPGVIRTACASPGRGARLLAEAEAQGEGSVRSEPEARS